MPAATATVGYCYDSDEDSEARGGGAARWTRDTGRVPLAARSCDACNHAGEHAHGLAASFAASSQAMRPALAGACSAALARAERAGVAAGDAVAAALLPPGRTAPGACLCESAVCGLEAVCDAAQPALAVVEGAVAPCVQPIGALMLALDRDVCADGGGRGQGAGLRAPVLRVLAGLERLGLALRSASAVVEEHMQPVSAALDARLGKLAHWGDSQLGIEHWATRSSASLCVGGAYSRILCYR